MEITVLIFIELLYFSTKAEMFRTNIIWSVEAIQEYRLSTFARVHCATYV